jgi:hypothetical protein
MQVVELAGLHMAGKEKNCMVTGISLNENQINKQCIAKTFGVTEKFFLRKRDYHQYILTCRFIRCTSGQLKVSAMLTTKAIS